MASSPASIRACRTPCVLFALAGLALAQETPQAQPDPASLRGAATAGEPCIAADGTSVYVAWTDARSGAEDVYFNRSLDGGTTWLSTDVRLDTGSAPGAASSTQVQIAAAGTFVGVVWCDARNGPQGKRDIHFNRSLDSGTTWLPSDVRLDVGSDPGAADSLDVQLAAFEASVYVVWSDGRHDPSGESADVYLNRSLDRGTTWLPADVRLDTGSEPGAGDSLDVQVAAFEASVYVVWSDDRHDPSGARADVYFNRSLDRGTTWLRSDVRLDVGSAPGTCRSEAPELAAFGTAVYVTWMDSRDDVLGVYFNRSVDRGVTWLLDDRRLDLGSPSGAGSARDPEVAAFGSSVYVTWSDRRHDPSGANADVYLNRSLDDGTDWFSKDVRLDARSAPGAASSESPQVAASGASVYVTWADARPGQASRSIHFNRSLDRGVSWLSSDVRLDSGSSP